MSLVLDAIRFCAASLVFLHHAAFPKFGTYLPWSLTKTGIEPVIVFFVLSGFVIAYAAELIDRTASQYALSRAARLLSVTVPALVVTAVLDSVGNSLAPKLYADHWSDPMTLANLQTPWLTQFSLSAFFMNELWFFDAWPGTNSPFWSLGYEATYYIIFGVIFFSRGSWQWVVVAGAVMVLIGPKVLLLLPIWIFGVAAWQLYRRVSMSPATGWTLLSLATLLYIAYLASGAKSALDGATERLLPQFSPSLYGMSAHFLSAYVSGVLFAIFILSFKGLESSFALVLSTFAPAIRALALCTFSMYLYHYPMIYFYRAVTLAITGREEILSKSWLATVFVLGGTVISVFILAIFTEHKKNVLRSWILSSIGQKRSAAARPILSALAMSTGRMPCAFGEHAQHVQEALAGRRAGVDRLLRGLQNRAACAHSADDVLKVADAPGEAINPGDHQNVAGVQEFQHRAQRSGLGRR
jgi:peptidoglycan/LPS O-acetylase OafA/YrhL